MLMQPEDSRPIAILQRHLARNYVLTVSASDQSTKLSLRLVRVSEKYKLPPMSQTHMQVKTDAFDLVTTTPHKHVCSKNATMVANGAMNAIPSQIL